jgi:preprotein translocase subunit YajC
MNSMVWLLAQAQQEAPGIASTIMMFGVIFLIFYFLVMRPQAKQAEKHRDFLGALKVGDEVVTDGGIFGRIAAIEDDVVQLEISRGTKVRVFKQKIRIEAPSAMKSKASGDGDGDGDKAEGKKDKKGK